MKQNNGSDGFYFNDYSPSSPWHWDYKGENAGESVPPVGSEAGVGGDQRKGVMAGFLDFFKGVAGEAGGSAMSDLMAGFEGVTGVLGSAVSDLLGGAGGAGGGGFGGFSGTAIPTTLPEEVQAEAKKMYEYVLTKGYTSAQAKGLIANIHRESTFDPKVRSGDDGGPGGLFQWKGSRQTAEVGRLVNAGDWKGQIDYALTEDAGPDYKSATANMSAQDSADWWMKKWERPADPAAGAQKHANFLSSYGFQNGGVVNMRGGGNSSTQMVSKSQQAFAEKIAEAVTPVVIPMPTGGGGGGGTVVEQGASSPFPSLPAEDSSIVSMEYKYRITMGASV
jgi:hypothetical protein